ncbi:PAS domain-containing sensor histidine kinase [Desulfonatronum thioautotrophicum]|uniref:PAS domain-containing sensor histidine kinase n=1 Tax=Desulfonatronum thioautotrophicum TaxID=617001 RepID=UPI00069A6A4E|nr:PAS domain-containing sensor histidine kinase [Desulfonatronum thioautotrophicum]
MQHDHSHELRALQERLAYLENEHRSIIEALNTAADLGDFRPCHNNCRVPREILRDTALRILRLTPFTAVGLWLVDETSHDFRLEHCEPDHQRQVLSNDFDLLVKEGITSLALAGEKPILAAGSTPEGRLLVQAIATSSRIRGLFIGHLRSHSFPDALHPLLVILCQSCAASLEALELYRLLWEKNRVLVESEDRFASVMAAINDGIWDWDIASGKLYVDERCYAMAGYEFKEFPSKMEEFERRIHPEDLDTVRQEIERHFLNDTSMFDVVYRFLKKNGEWMWIRRRGSIVRRDEQGKPARMLGTYTDITEGKQSEAARKALQEQLDQTQKMETVGVLAGGVAHDFNNLLHIMAGSIDMLSRGVPIDNQANRHLAILDRCIQRASQLVRQLLTFSRKAKREMRLLDLNAAINEVRSLFERTLPKMITIEMCLEEELWPINADPLQVEQVLLNLAANAADAMPQGGNFALKTSNAHLDAECSELHRGIDPGRYVLLSVSDTGCGMAKETLLHIFEPFFTTKDMGKGTGLGLATVYGIVKGHGGHIFASSEPGKGSTFSIFWPTADPREQHCDMVLPSEVHAHGGTEYILIVDDEADIRTLTSEALESFGYKTASVSNGEEALRLYAEHGHSIDMVILDLSMPGMGGRQCLLELLRMDPKARVLVASGYSASGQIDDVLHVGAAGFIGKPFRINELEGKVREILDAEA